MNHPEFLRLLSYQSAKQRAPHWQGTSRRTAKKGRVQVLKHSRIVSEVGLVRQYNFPQHQQPINHI